MKKSLNIFIMLFTFISVFSYEFPDEVVFAAVRPDTDPTTRWLIELGTEAFNRIGINFKFINLPPRRVMQYGDSGQIDGDIGRIYNYSDLHPNLIRIEEHTIIIHFSAFSLDKSIELSGWESLRNTSYRVERRLGIKGAELGLKNVVPEDMQSVAKDIDEALRKLKAERTDIYVDTRDYVLKIMESEEFKSYGIDLYEVGIMHTITSHMHLHKKHKELAPIISEELKKMKEEGRFEYYKKKMGININW